MKGSFWVLFGSIWAAVGLPFLLIAAYLTIEERRFDTQGRMAEGMVLTKEIRCWSMENLWPSAVRRPAR